MLWPSDERLVARDTALPGLAFILDEDAVAGWLRERAPHAGIRSARARYARYKPATSCLIAYDVDCASGSIGVTVKAYRSPSVEKIEKARRLMDLPSKLGPAAFVLPQAMVVVTVFPYDLRLRSLRHLMGPMRDRVLDALLPGIGHDLTVHVLSYKPERRLVARVDGYDPAIVRVYAADEYAAGAGRRIGTATASARLARTLARHPRYPIVATEWLPGDVGTVVLAAPARARAIGETLAALHGGATDSVGSWTRSAKDELRHLRQVGNGLADLLPKSAARIEYLSGALAEGIGRVDAPPVLTHGDFAMQQVVFRPDGVALTDLDQAAIAHPASDIGSFVADVEYRSLVGTITTGQAAEVVAAFLEGYRSVHALPCGVDVYTAAALLRRAPLPFRTRMKEWPERIDQVIDRCEVLPWRLGHRSPAAAAPRRVATLGSRGHRLDAAMPWLEAALDPVGVTRLFANAPWGGGAMTVDSALRIRHKPGRRCLVRYALRGGVHDVVLGKTRAKGLDRRTAQLNETLYEREFSSDSVDGIEVPPFVGLVPELRMWLQAAVSGQPASAHLRTGDRDVARRLADVVLKLQRLGPQPGRAHTIADELRILDQRLSALAARHPSWRERLARLLDGCVSLAATLPQSPLVPTHRDFYPEQVIVCEHRLIVLDFDLYALAHPALDAGNCLAHTIEFGMRPGADRNAIDEVVGVLREALAAGLSFGSGPAVDVFTTLALVRLIEIDDRLEDRQVCVEPLLELCEARLAQAGLLSSARQHVAVPGW